MKKNLLLLGISAVLCSQLNAFDYEIKDGDQMLGAVVDIEDFTPFHNKCVNYLYHQDLNTGDIKLHSANWTISGYEELTKLTKGEGFVLSATGDCTVTLATLADNQIEFNNKIYTEIVSPTTSRVWLDKNIGAVNTCNKELADYNTIEEYNTYESGCYGDYYQWGRKADGHQLRTSSTTLDAQVSIDNTNNKFVINENTANSADYGDWVDSNTLEERQTRWQSVTGNSVCPIGFRVPMLNEVNAEFADPAIAVTTLKLPYSGVRYSSYEAKIYSEGQYGAIWTTTIAEDPMNNYPMRANFSSTGYNTALDDKARGIPVRCIKAN